VSNDEADEVLSTLKKLTEARQITIVTITCGGKTAARLEVPPKG